ncbi:toxin C-terminal domain-containing protein [Helicobacter sp. 11S02596-1]|uniref:toxin C-terminal domain-containing protein n=1 Tax=Helicobacter sp. 11S02596-1 TaxID=1476194 RepID=UPI000BA748E3|nr:toxin C-terminal domain-containing protein [Helicobacter sp. 11S02596-1]PAF44761.1 hypothetical protein BJI48_01880 [Helicobacter sp. 11S02596-1]
MCKAPILTLSKIIFTLLFATAGIANASLNLKISLHQGFDGEVKLYNNDPTTKGYADTLNGKNTIGFNTRTNNLVQSKGVINTIFHETTDKATHHHNEQTALNRGNTAGNIWELKNFSNAIAQRNSQRKNASNNQLASKLTTQEWNKQYANDKILQLGNALNDQSRTQNTQENGERDERGIIKSIPALKYLDPHYLIEKGGNAIIKWSKKLGKNKDDSNVKVPQRPEGYSEESTNNPQTQTGEKKESKQEAKQETPQSANPPVKNESAKEGKGNNQGTSKDGGESKAGEAGEKSATNKNGKFQNEQEAKRKAEELGYKKDKQAGKSNGADIYKHPKKNSYITRDQDSHNGGAWKEANSPRNLGKKETRNGTFDRDLNKIGD